MPISDEPNKILYYTDGTVREFSFNFKFFNTSDIHVSFWTEGEGVYLEENKDYEIDYTDKEGGSVVLLGNRGVNGYPATPHPGTLLISRVMPLNQQANIRPVSGFPEEVITNTFDKLVMIDQQQEEELQRCLKLPGNSLVSDLTLPEPVANNSLIWDEDGTKLVNYDLKGENEAFKQEIVELNQVLEGNINTQFNNFKSETNQQFSNFKTEINDNIETFKDDINTNIEEVLEASEKVNQLEESVATATNASKVATEQATIAKQQASIATNKANEAVASVNNRTPIFSKNELQTNEGVYQNVYDLKHSTFDLSKFEVVGSPTITSDGVVSGFSGSSCVKLVNITELVYQANSWEINVKFTTGTVVNSTQAIIGDALEGGVWKPRLTMDTNGRLGVLLSTASGDWQINFKGTSVLNKNTTYYIKIVFTGTMYQLFISNDGEIFVLDGQAENSTKIRNTNYLNTLGANTSTGGLFGIPFNGSIDLKQFSITVDGKEVFNGNKTGLDVIKPDDYTVVGSPNITSDGVASGFSASNYIEVSPATTGEEFVIFAKGRYKSGTNEQVLYRLGSSIDKSLIGNIRIAISSSRVLSCRAYANNIDSNLFSYVTLNINDGDIFECKLTLKKDVQTLQYKINDKEYILTNSLDWTNYSFSPINNLKIGSYASGVLFWNDSIDLNSFKIYVDGNLIYQPCLKIPYTESKTGSKIVPAYARDRVQDVFEQYGQAEYYTIDEENKNFTLPMGEIYGMIENAKTDLTSVLNKTQITNCLLEVPEKIKYTLQNGVLTLKTGSEIVIPNGFESDGTTRKFNKVILNKELTFAYGGKAENLVICATASGQFFSTIMTYALSGTSEPTVGANRVIWFDATNNIVKTKTSGGSWTTGLSFPLFIVDLDSSTKVANLKNVFNGFGFIGHHTFSYEGIKALIPNGRNADGTFKNKETITTSINVRDEAGRGSLLCFWDGTNILTYGVNNYFEQDTQPVFNGQHGMWLNTKENIMYSTSDYSATWVAQPRMNIGRLKKTIATGDFVEASFKTPVELVKKGDIERNLVEVKAYITETYSSGTSWYDVYSNGKIRQGVALTANGTVTFLKPFSNTDYSIVSSGCIRYSSKAATAIAISDINVGNSDKPFPCYLVFEGY